MSNKYTLQKSNITNNISESIILSNKASNNAIIVLTRGYNNIDKYNMLIKRNISIENNLVDKTIDVIIFNENNITIEQQMHIKKMTPSLNIIFVDISNGAFYESKKNIVSNKIVEHIPINYKHMCSFWFVDFWKFVQNYDRVLRIDEDCVINFNIDTIFYLLENKVAVFGHWEKDLDFVTKGISNFTCDFLEKNHIVYCDNNSRKIYGPYTNIIALNLQKIRNNKLLFEYIDLVDKSNNIYIWRWGDLPLWGEVLTYFYTKNDYILTKTIKYYHKSHKKYVNY